MGRQTRQGLCPDLASQRNIKGRALVWFLGSVAVAAFIGFSHTASGEEAKRPAIAVRAYNYAAVPDDTMRRASDTVIRIYREAGVDIEWIEPLADPPHSGNSTRSSPNMFAVRMMIRPKRVSGGPSTRESESVMGIALEADEKGGTVSLFYDQVLRAAREYKQPLADILALAIAHEIGHLLLPFPAHSPTGVMRSDWNGDNIRHAVLGSLTFTPAQADLIRRKAAACCDAQRLNGAR